MLVVYVNRAGLVFTKVPAPTWPLPASTVNATDGGDIVKVTGAELPAIASCAGMSIELIGPCQRRALVIADNQLALGAGWDEGMLRVELRALQGEDYDIDLIGFGESELAELLADDSDYTGHADEDAVPEPSEIAISVPGDLWLLGDHRVYCGDATQMESIEKVMAGGLADMVFCDPPYSVAYGSSAPTKREREKRRITNDDLSDMAFGELLRKACANLLSVTKGAVYISMSSSELHTLQKAFTAAGGHWSTFVIWAKDRFTLGRSDYQRQYEPMLYGWREGTDHFWCGAGIRATSGS